MANSVVISTLLDGSDGFQKGRITIIKVDIIADTTAEITGYKIFNASLYGNKTVNKKLYNLRYCLNGFNAALFWGVSGSVSTNLLLTCETDHYNEQEFDNTVSSISNIDITNHDGNIYLSTKNLTAGDIGYLILAIQHSRE